MSSGFLGRGASAQVTLDCEDKYHSQKHPLPCSSFTWVFTTEQSIIWHGMQHPFGQLRSVVLDASPHKNKPCGQHCFSHQCDTQLHTGCYADRKLHNTTPARPSTALLQDFSEIPSVRLFFSPRILATKWLPFTILKNKRTGWGPLKGSPHLYRHFQTLFRMFIVHNFLS